MLPEGTRAGSGPQGDPGPADEPAVPGIESDVSAPIGSWTWWPTTDRMLWSEGVYEIFGLDPDAVEPSLEHVLDRVIPEQCETIRELTTDATEEGTIERTVRIRRADDQERRLHVVARARVDAEGVPDHWRGTVVDTTDLPGALQETVQSEAAYRTLLGDMLAVVYRTKSDPVDGELEFLGPYTHEVLGYEPEAFRGDRELWRDSVHPEDREAFAAARSRVTEEGQPQLERYRFETGTSGDWIWLEDHLFPIRDEEGRVTGVTGIARDVTEEHENRMRYKALVHALPDFVLVARRDGTIEQIAETSMERTYRPQEEIVGRRIQDVVPDEHRERFLAAIEQAVESQELVTLRYDLPVDGKMARFEGRVNPINGDRVLWLARDISERAQALEAVGRQEQDLRLAEEIAGLGYWSWWPDRDEVEWSLGLHQLYGLDRDEVEPSYEAFLDLVHPDDRDRIDETIRSALQDEERWVAEYRIKRPDGETRVLRSIGRFRTDEAGASRMFGTSLDVTELREEQDQLAQRAEQLQEANLELKRYAHAVAHELKEPVRNVVSYAQMLDEEAADDLDPEAREMLEQVVDGVGRMGDRIDDLLTYSEEGRASRHPERVELEAAVEAGLHRLEEELQAAEADVTVGELGAVQADRADVLELFEQLLENAVNFRAEGVPLEIDVDAHAQGGMRVVSIGDNGTGIPAGHSDGVFELFERFHTLSEGGGAGIGLAICRRIVEHYDGQIQVDSAEGEGATVRFSLPDADG